MPARFHLRKYETEKGENMVTIKINDKDYNFVFNANTSELYYQVFGEDLFELSVKSNEDKTLFLKRSRLQKLAFIGYKQAQKPVRELAGRLSLVQYLEWAEQFDSKTFEDKDIITELVSAWRGSFQVTAEEKNPDSQQ